VEVFGLDHRGASPRRLVEPPVDDDRRDGAHAYELLRRRRRGFGLGVQDRRTTEHGQGRRQPRSRCRASLLRRGFARHVCTAT
jgi:hypothetical protein